VQQGLLLQAARPVVPAEEAQLEVAETHQQQSWNHLSKLRMRKGALCCGRRREEARTPLVDS